MPRYKVLAALGEPGDIIEQDWTPEEEDSHVAAGHCEIHPERYRVVGGSTVHGIKPNDEGEMSLTIGQRDALIEGGAIAPAQEKPKALAGGKKDDKTANQPKEAK